MKRAGYEGTSDQNVNDQFEFKIINSCVANLRNSPAITFDSRLEIDPFEFQLDSPSFNQRLLNVKVRVTWPV
jgi:hypothetical protein